jgi:hypothetical protein
MQKTPKVALAPSSPTPAVMLAEIAALSLPERVIPKFAPPIGAAPSRMTCMFRAFSSSPSA